MQIGYNNGHCQFLVYAFFATIRKIALFSAELHCFSYESIHNHKEKKAEKAISKFQLK